MVRELCFLAVLRKISSMHRSHGLFKRRQSYQAFARLLLGLVLAGCTFMPLEADQTVGLGLCVKLQRMRTKGILLKRVRSKPLDSSQYVACFNMLFCFGCNISLFLTKDNIEAH